MSSSPALLPLLTAALLVGCNKLEPQLPLFNGPDRSVVLSPEQGGPWNEPVGFVASTRSGTIVPLDLKHGIPLGDSLSSPFLRARAIATGDERQLGAVAVLAPSEDQVTLYAADLAFDVLVEAPYIVGLNGDATQVYEAASDGGIFLDEDGSGDNAVLQDLLLRRGFTTSELWSIEYNGELWWVTGSRSGKQGMAVATGEPFRADNGELEFTIAGTASSGDRIELTTDVGILEHDLGGPILELSQVPGEQLLLAAVWEAATDSGALVLWDPASGVELSRLPLAGLDLTQGSQPYRFSWVAEDWWDDADQPELFIADAHQPVVWQLALDLADLSLSTVAAIETSDPVVSVAWVGDGGSLFVDPEDVDPNDPEADSPYEHLFVATALSNRVDVYDLARGEWLDVNPMDDVLGGLDLQSPIVGLAGTPDRIMLQTETNWGARKEDLVVAVTTADGSLRMLEGRSGCLATELGGADITANASGDDFSIADRGADSNPVLYTDPATGERVIFPECGGITRSETWTLTYDGVSGTWELEGSESGVQATPVIEDERYLSDDGAVSLLLLAGPAPSTDGDTIIFQSKDGVLRIDAAGRTSTSTRPFELPASPVVFQYRTGPTGGGWDPESLRTYALVPITNSDMTVRVRLQAWQVEAIWD